MAQLDYDGKHYRATFEIEQHAAYQYNIWLQRYSITCTNANNVVLPKDFQEYISPIKNGQLPKGIYLTKQNRYHVQVRCDGKAISYGTYPTLEAALNVHKKAMDDRAQHITKHIMSQPIAKDENNNPVIILKDKHGNKVGETIVDENIYYHLMHFKWRMHVKTGYVLGRVDKQDVYLHRYVLEYSGNEYVDHINSNKLDNRKLNLRVVTIKQNSQNKSKAKSARSKYIGVNWHKGMKKWEAKIVVDKTKIHLGYFDDEERAAHIRDNATKTYYGQYGKLNFS